MLGPIHFHGSHMQLSGTLYFYEVVDLRPPRAGEYYLSGAILAAYQAHNDLSTTYTVVRKVARAVPTTGYQPAPLED